MRRTATALAIILTAGAGASPPTDHDGQISQIGLAHFVDVGRPERPVENRYGPNAPSAGWSYAVDPTDPDLKCMRTFANGSFAFDDLNGMEQVTERLRDAGYRTEAHDDVVIMFEMYLEGAAYDDDNGQGYGEFFILRTALGQETETGLKLRHARWTAGYKGELQAWSDGAFISESWIDWDRVPAGQWTTVLMRYRASSEPLVRTDGRIDIWIAPKRMADVIPQIDFRQVVAGRLHDRGPARRYRLGASSSAGGFAPATHYFARLCRGLWDTDLATTFYNVRYRNYGLEAGVDLPSSAGGLRDVAVTYRHDRALLGGGGGVMVRLQSATSPDFTGAETTDPLPLDEALDWQETFTLAGLAADTEHWVRAIVEIGAGRKPERTILTEPIRIRTLTRDRPGVVRFVVGACTTHGPSRTPNRTFETIAVREHGLNFVAHLGDQAYVDRHLVRFYGEDEWQKKATVQDVEDVLALIMGDYAQSVASAAVPMWRQWDDHEVVDSWYGADVEPLTYVRARAGFRIYTKHCRPPMGSPFYGPVPSPADLQSAPGAFDGVSPALEPWQRGDVFYWYTESANTLFVMLDTRTLRSQEAGTMLGPTQLAWLIDLITSTDKEHICLFSQVRWSDGNVNKADDYWGTSATAEGFFLDERRQIIDAFRKAKGDTGFLLLLSGDDHMSTATRHHGLGGHPNVYEVLNGGFCVRNHGIDDLPTWFLAPGSYEWLTNNDLHPNQTLRIYVVVQIDEISGVIDIAVKDGNTGETIGRTVQGGSSRP